MTDLTIVDDGAALSVRVGDLEIARYVFRPESAVSEGPKPYLHPVRALDGAILTGYRPWDHRWHKGLQMTWTHVSGQNFWGGPTYVHPDGYRPLENVGEMRHKRFAEVTDAGDAVGFTEELLWVTQDGREWMTETRTHRFGGVDTERGLWVLDFDTTLTNISGHDLELGSPTTQGRPKAGYTGFVLRMPRAWTGGAVLGSGGEDADALMGAEADWVRFTGRHDDVDGAGSILAFAGRSTGAPPIRWFVRSEPFPVLAPSPSYDETITLGPGEELSLTHRHVFGDAEWSDELTRQIAGELRP